MPFGDFVNVIPPLGFLIVHLALFAAGSYFAWRAFNAESPTIGAGFALFALAEVVYMTYHLDWTVFLFAHTIAEVLNLLAFGLLFAGVTRTVLGRAPSPVRA